MLINNQIQHLIMKVLASPCSVPGAEEGCTSDSCQLLVIGLDKVLCASNKNTTKMAI